MSLAQSGKLVFASGKVGDYDIWTLDLATGETRQLTRGTWWHDKPSWSPDGRWVLFTSNRGGGPGQDVFRCDATGNHLEALTSLGKWTDSPTYSPDGRKIAFVSNESGNNDVWIMDADGRNREKVTEHLGSDNHVRWMPDGRGLLFSSDRDRDADIWHIDLSSGRKRQLNSDRGADITPCPSPDGSLIAFCSDRQRKPDPSAPHDDRDKDIWLMGADGSFPVRLTENQGADFAPCWSPDGQAILYTAEAGHADCHLRVIDVRDLTAAYQANDPKAIAAAVVRLWPKRLEYDRTGMVKDIDAERTPFWFTAWMPQRWLERIYPMGYFGKERNAHWV